LFKYIAEAVKLRDTSFKKDRVARFIECCHAIRDEDTHQNIHKDLMEEWWTWWEQQRSGGRR
jgi:hypothetical protein